VDAVVSQHIQRAQQFRKKTYSIVSQSEDIGYFSLIFGLHQRVETQQATKIQKLNRRPKRNSPVVVKNVVFDVGLLLAFGSEVAISRQPCIMRLHRHALVKRGRCARSGIQMCSIKMSFRIRSAKNMRYSCPEADLDHTQTLRQQGPKPLVKIVKRHGVVESGRRDEVVPTPFAPQFPKWIQIA